MSGDPLLSVAGLTVEYTTQGRRFAAVSELDLDIHEGETVGLVGESGCGKSTTGRAILQVPKPTRGKVVFEGIELTELLDNELRHVRRRLRIIFQDPVSSLNPRRLVRDIVAEPLAIEGIATSAERESRVREVLEAVGIDPVFAMGRRPHEFSGGQCQRICIARALITKPKLVVCDEPVSALDVSVQAQILNLLEDMKQHYGLTLLFISHELAVVKNISDRVAVMYLGKLCELAESARLYETPAHPYTAGLMAAIPSVEAGRTVEDGPPMVNGEVPSPLNPPSGCRYRTRCPRAKAICASEDPPLRRIGDAHDVACHFPLLESDRSFSRQESRIAGYVGTL